jgi:hypothetical protein
MRRWGVDVILVEPGDSLTGKPLLQFSKICIMNYEMVKIAGALEWFSEERVLRQAREAWQAMKPSQREEYGETHFQETVRAVHDYIKDDKVNFPVQNYNWKSFNKAFLSF